jgi:YD repeat-containing protein
MSKNYYTKTPIIIYDENGNNLYVKDPNGLEKYYAYDKDNRAILYKDSNGVKLSYLYDEYGRKTYCKDQLGRIIDLKFYNVL